MNSKCGEKYVFGKRIEIWMFGWRLEAISGFRNPKSSISRLSSCGHSASFLIPPWNSKKLFETNLKMCKEVSL